jgi:enterochelin esterase-like enzyme
MNRVALISLLAFLAALVCLVAILSPYRMARLSALFATAGPTPVVPATATPPAAASPTTAIPTGVVRTEQVFSPALGKDLNYTIYLPGEYSTSAARYRVIYLLHGRGDSMASWEPVASLIDDMIRAGQIPPLILVLPDAPSSKRAGYYVDSLFAGNSTLPAGEKVETALTVDLLTHVDRTYRTIANRNGRAVAGYSMGGYGALRYVLAHPYLFRAAIALSPAVYVPLPPASSSTREFGAFGTGNAVFDDAVYAQKDYPALFAAFEAANLPSALFIAVGDDEDANINPTDAVHDLDYEAHTLYNKARRVKNLQVQLRVLDGGHNWEVWRPGLLEGLQYILRFMKAEQ